MLLVACFSACGGSGDSGGTGPDQSGSGSGISSSSSSPTQPPPSVSRAPTVYVADTQGYVSALAITEGTGALTAVSGSPFPSSGEIYDVAIDPKGPFLYAAASNASYINAFSISPSSGVLTPLSRGPFFTSGAPVALTVDPNGELVFTANQGSNNISVFAIGADGSLMSLPGSPYPAGTTPWDVTVHPKLPFMYVANAQDATITAYQFDASKGTLTAIAGSPFLTGGKYPESLAIDPPGRFLYVADFMKLAIEAFSIDQTTGALQAVPGSPFYNQRANTAVVVDASGQYLYVASGGAVSSYAIDASTGALTLISETANPALSNGTYADATALSVEPSGNYLYALDSGNQMLSGFAIDPQTGALTGVPGNPLSLALPNDIYTIAPNRIAVSQ